MRRLWFILIFILFSASALAEQNEFAIELEIAPMFIGPLTNMFDLNALPRPHVDGTTLPNQAPILSKYDLDGLPNVIRRQLTEGVDLDAVTEFRLIDPKDAKLDTKTPPGIPKFTGLLGVDGRPLAKLQGMQIVQQRWEAEWKKYSPAERAVIIPLSLLPVGDRIELVMRNLNTRSIKDQAAKPRLRRDLPPEIAKILQGTYWEIDQDQFEIKDNVATADKTALLARWKRIAALAHIPTVLTAPENNDTRSGYHLNVSRSGIKHNLEPLVALYQARLVTNSVSGGHPERVFGGGGQVQYNPELTDRGLVRIKKSNFFEVRVHTDDLESEMNYLDRMLDLPLFVARQEMVDEIQVKLTLGDLKTIGQHRPFAVYDILRLLEEENPAVLKFNPREAKVTEILADGVTHPEHAADLLEIVARYREEKAPPNYLKKLSAALHQRMNPAVLKQLARHVDVDDFFEFMEVTAMHAGDKAKYQADSPEVIEALVKGKLESNELRDVWLLLKVMEPHQRARPAVRRFLEKNVTPEEWLGVTMGGEPSHLHDDIGFNLTQLMLSQRAEEDRGYFLKMREVLSDARFKPGVEAAVSGYLIKNTPSDVIKAHIIELADRFPNVRKSALTFYNDGSSLDIRSRIRSRIAAWESSLPTYLEQFSNAPRVQSAMQTEFETILGHPIGDCPLGEL